MSKITRATLKSFIRKNKDNLFIHCKRTFNGMTDGVDYIKDSRFREIKETEDMNDMTLGIEGVWCVGSSRDYF